MQKMAASLAMARVRLRAEPCLSCVAKAAIVCTPFTRRVHTFSRRLMLSSSQAPSSSLSATPFSAGSPRSVGFRRPDEIPWKHELVNNVTLIGCINQDIDLRYLDSGKIMAMTSLRVKRNVHLRASSFDSVFIVQFWEELAEIAAAHVKKEDRVYIAGSLWVESYIDKESVSRSSCKIVAKDLKFVCKDIRDTSCVSSRHEMEARAEHLEDTFSDSFDEKIRMEQVWRDYFKNPFMFWDNRLSKRSATYPDFKHKTSGVMLWIESKDTPQWVHSRLAETSPEAKPESKGEKSKLIEKSWQLFFADPKEWWDNRSTKALPHYPDFKSKLTGDALWLDSPLLPRWVKSQLELLDSVPKSRAERGGKGYWADGMKEKTPKTSFEDEDFNFL